MGKSRGGRTDHGGQDRWVDNKSRDMLIRVRGRKYVPLSTSHIAPVAATFPSTVTTTVIAAATISTPSSQQGRHQRNGWFAEEHHNEEDWKPRVIICERGLPHGFCIGTFYIDLHLEFTGYCYITRPCL